MSRTTRTAAVAWLITAVYYFYQYTLRSAPAVMMPQLSEAFGLTAMGVASMAGPLLLRLLAVQPRRRRGDGPARAAEGRPDRRGGGRHRRAAVRDRATAQAASVGRLLQGAGGVFALVGAAYIATTNFPASRAATLIGATQMFGMAGGSAGQFVVGPMIGAGVSLEHVLGRRWASRGLVISVLLFLLLPRRRRSARRDDWLKRAATRDAARCSRNPQSILCGMIAGLLFIPTTIFDMIWGVRYLQEARGFDYADAVMRSSTVPLGWIIGCPLLGFVSDRIGRRKPVIVGRRRRAAAVPRVDPLRRAGPVSAVRRSGSSPGIASGAAMLPYTVIKEANPPRVSGTATGVVNFLNFTFSALLGPVFGWLLPPSAAARPQCSLEHYQTAFQPLLYGVALAVRV